MGHATMVTTLETDEFTGRRVAILGMARTGMAAAPVLASLGAQVRLSDSEPEHKLRDRLAEASGFGVELLPGADPEEALEGADIVIPSPGIRPESAVLQMAVERGIRILSEIEVAFRIARA